MCRLLSLSERAGISIVNGAAVGFAIALLLPPGPGFAQTKPFDDPTEIVDDEAAQGLGFRSGSLVAAPIPFESPSLGTGLALGGAYLFKSDRVSDTSSLSFGGFKSSNGSQAFGLGLNLAWDEDRWKVKFALADASLNYDVFVAGTQVLVSQSLRGGTFEIGYSPSEYSAFGGSIGYGKYSLSRRDGNNLPPEYQRDAELKVARISAFAEYDTRDDTFYPTTGTLVNGTIIGGYFVDNNRSGYNKGVVSGRGYHPVFSDSVVAGQAVACIASDDAPFFDSCSLGGTDGFRGYVSTEFLDNALVSFQAEIRTRLTSRIGVVAFVGAGSVGNDFGKALEGDYLAAAGVGLRIRLSKTFPLDYAIDMATNDRGEQLLYVSVGQRF